MYFVADAYFRQAIKYISSAHRQKQIPAGKQGCVSSEFCKNLRRILKILRRVFKKVRRIFGKNTPYFFLILRGILGSRADFPRPRRIYLRKYVYVFADTYMRKPPKCADFCTSPGARFRKNAYANFSFIQPYLDSAFQRTWMLASSLLGC